MKDISTESCWWKKTSMVRRQIINEKHQKNFLNRDSTVISGQILFTGIYSLVWDKVENSGSRHHVSVIRDFTHIFLRVSKTGFFYLQLLS